MPVEFTVRTDDLKRATKQLQLDRQEFADSDFADLKVSASMVDLKAIGTATSIAANGKQTGTARLPLRVLVRVVEVARMNVMDARSDLLQVVFLVMARPESWLDQLESDAFCGRHHRREVGMIDRLTKVGRVVERARCRAPVPKRKIVNAE